MQFKFVAGPHLGAQLSLEPGSYTLGTGAECDLIVAEALEQPCTVRLMLDESGALSAALIEGSAKLDGKALGEEPQPWPEGTVLTIGLSALVPFSGSFSLEKLDLASLGLVSAPQTAAEAQSAETEAPAQPEEAPADTAAAAEPSFAAPEAAACAAAAAKKQRRRLLLLTLPGLAALLLLLSALSAGSYLYGERAQQREAVAQAQRFLQQQGWHTVAVSFADGLLRFKGTLPGADDLGRLAAELPPSPYAAAFEITFSAEKLQALERALGVLGAQVKAAAAADGKVSLYGYVKDPYVEAELLNAVQPYFADLVLQPHFKYFEEALPLLQEQSRKLQLPLEWGSADTALIYSGRLTFAERGRMEELRTAVSTALGVPLKFLNADEARQVLIARINDPKAVAALMQSAAGVPEAAAPTADSAAPAESTGAFRVQDVIGVTMQPLRFITLKSGQKFFEGAVLPGGAVLQQISLDRLVLNQHGREVSYELN